jgi:hypothetical protein
MKIKPRRKLRENGDYPAEGNEKVLNFYRRFGFAERFVVMQKRNA